MPFNDFIMGKIKSKLIRRTTDNLLGRDIEFTESFDKNKKLLGNTMPSKKIRNQIAGLVSKIKRTEAVSKEDKK